MSIYIHRPVTCTKSFYTAFISSKQATQLHLRAVKLMQVLQTCCMISCTIRPISDFRPKRWKMWRDFTPDLCLYESEYHVKSYFLFSRFDSSTGADLFHFCFKSSIWRHCIQRKHEPSLAEYIHTWRVTKITYFSLTVFICVNS